MKLSLLLTALFLFVSQSVWAGGGGGSAHGSRKETSSAAPSIRQNDRGIKTIN